MLMTNKSDYIFTSDQLWEFDKRDLYLVEWRWVQAIASIFWSRSRKEYQLRRKQTENSHNLIEGDLTLLKDKKLCRTQWPVGIIVNSLKSSDKHVRKAELRVIVNGKATTYLHTTNHGHDSSRREQSCLIMCTYFWSIYWFYNFIL